jgi:glycosyltransferase involved in cell wall biosynthesis
MRDQSSIIFLMSSLAVGGAERQTMALAREFSTRSRVVVAYLKPMVALLPQLHQEPLIETAFLDAHDGFDRAAAQRLARLIDQHAAQTIVCVNSYPLVHAHLARRLAGHKPNIVAIFHTTKLRTLSERLRMLIYTPFYWFTDQLIYVSRNQRRHWSRRGLFARRTTVIHNGVDTSHFAPTTEEQAREARARCGWDAHDRVVGIAAVLRPEKAHALLLDAVARCKARGRPWKVLVIGDGPMRPRIEARIDALDLRADVVITGLLQDVRPAMHACDVMAIVSNAIETFSIAALEALSMGKPMIMSNIGGADEQIVPGTNGMLFPPDDAEALASCLDICWDRKRSEAMGRQARQGVLERFTQEGMFAAYEQTFARLRRSPSHDPARTEAAEN